VAAPAGAQITEMHPVILAAWNFFPIEGNDSFGVHNPRFTRTVLLTTLDALK
jgi:hypothetical protein